MADVVEVAKEVAGGAIALTKVIHGVAQAAASNKHSEELRLQCAEAQKRALDLWMEMNDIRQHNEDKFFCLFAVWHPSTVVRDRLQRHLQDLQQQQPDLHFRTYDDFKKLGKDASVRFSTQLKELSQDQEVKCFIMLPSDKPREVDGFHLCPDRLGEEKHVQHWEVRGGLIESKPAITFTSPFTVSADANTTIRFKKVGFFGIFSRQAEFDRSTSPFWGKLSVRLDTHSRTIKTPPSTLATVTVTTAVTAGAGYVIGASVYYGLELAATVFATVTVGAVGAPVCALSAGVAAVAGGLTIGGFCVYRWWATGNATKQQGWGLLEDQCHRDAAMCPHCKQHTRHKLKDPNSLPGRRWVYECTGTGCKKKTLPCRRRSCPNMARGWWLWDDDFCPACSSQTSTPRRHKSGASE